METYITICDLLIWSVGMLGGLLGIVCLQALLNRRAEREYIEKALLDELRELNRKLQQYIDEQR